MEHKGVLVFFLLYIEFCNCNIFSCNNVTNATRSKCNCFSYHDSEMEIQCPNDMLDPEFLILINKKSKRVTIDCCDRSSNNTFNSHLIPNINIGNKLNLNLRQCPLSKEHFNGILDKFSKPNIKILSCDGLFGNNFDENYLENLTSLETLMLSNMNLKSLHENIFVNTPKLTRIDLQKDEISTLKPELFRPTPLLKSLDLSQNLLETLSKDLFQNLKKLKTLYLWHNMLKEINDLTFSNLSNLEILELSFNKISKISENAFVNLKNLKEISLSKNNLFTVPSYLFQHNIMLEKIVLKDNFDLKLPNYFLSNLNSLKFVHLGNCKLQFVPENIFDNSTNMYLIHLNDNLLSELPAQLFNGLNKLKTIFLQNNKIKNISIVQTFPKSLQIIHLDNNLITTIERDTFQNFDNLEEIYIRKNQISEIDYRAFNYENLNKMKIVDLSFNMITKPTNYNDVPSAIFEDVVNIVDINLSHNLITKIEDIIFLDNKLALKKLDLRYNHINNLRIPDLIITAQNRKSQLELKLDGNNLTTIDFALGDQTLSPYLSEEYFHRDGVTSYLISLSNNPFECDCHNYDLYRYYKHELPPRVYDLIKIPFKNVICYRSWMNHQLQCSQ